MTDEQRREKQPLSMTRRYRRGLILTGVLCVLAMLAAATVLFQRSYTDRVDDYLAQLGGSYAAAYKAQPTHDAKTLVSLLPKPGVDAPRFTLIGGDGKHRVRRHGLPPAQPRRPAGVPAGHGRRHRQRHP